MKNVLGRHLWIIMQIEGGKDRERELSEENENSGNKEKTFYENIRSDRKKEVFLWWCG